MKSNPVEQEKMMMLLTVYLTTIFDGTVGTVAEQSTTALRVSGLISHGANICVTNI